jgi:hypothetical protein
VRVTAGAGAALISATIARNGSGVRAAGKTSIRNAIITANAIGVDAADASLVASRYNDVFGNGVADYRGAGPAASDRSDAVAFGEGDDDLRLTRAQPSTDRGDPADEFINEPEPNGGRINQGAFGNTPFAELSDQARLPPPAPPAPGQEPTPKAGSSGAGGGRCALAGPAGGPDGALALVTLALLVRRRRQTRRT